MFHLQKITIQKHPIFGYVNLDFGEGWANHIDINGNATTVIIGRNGIGKSYLLRAITDIFRVLGSIIKGEGDFAEFTFRFSITYLLDGHIYTATNFNNGLEPVSHNIPHSFNFFKDGRPIERRSFGIPNSVIASSMTIADKFPTPSSTIYKYRGVRNEKTPSTTGTRTIVRKAVEGIMDSLAQKHTTREEVATILSELGFQPHLEIKYRLRYKDVFVQKNMNPELLEDIYTNWQNYFKGRTGEVWGTRYYQTLSNHPEKIEMVCSYLRRYADILDTNRQNQILYDVFDEDNSLVYDSEAIKLLSNLDILSFPEFLVYKKDLNDGYDFVNSSSGETQQFCQFISIMSAIEHNSLILIDEPENSSHPNWQMKYIGWLQKIFTEYRDCHFIIATHSHFLLTDLNPEWSNIIALDKTINGLVNIADGMNTFCWSTDDILYRVFHVRNTRNYVFEDEVMELYSLISNGKKNSNRAKQLHLQLKTYVLPGNDPLLRLIKMMEDD